MCSPDQAQPCHSGAFKDESFCFTNSPAISHELSWGMGEGASQVSTFSKLPMTGFSHWHRSFFLHYSNPLQQGYS